MTERDEALTRPDFIGIVSGAQWKLENGEDGVTEYALAVVWEGKAALFEASTEDLKYLANMITGLVGE